MQDVERGVQTSYVIGTRPRDGKEFVALEETHHVIGILQPRPALTGKGLEGGFGLDMGLACRTLLAKTGQKETFALGLMGHEMIDRTGRVAQKIATDVPRWRYGYLDRDCPQLLPDIVDVVFIFKCIIGTGAVNQTAALFQ